MIKAKHHMYGYVRWLHYMLDVDMAFELSLCVCLIQIHLT